MARVAGVNIPAQKRIEIALTYIHGIGRKTALEICVRAGVPVGRRVHDLTDAEVLGPLVVGLGGAASVIPVGATVNEIVNITTYTVVQALSGQDTPSATYLPRVASRYPIPGPG